MSFRQLFGSWRTSIVKKRRNRDPRHVDTVHIGIMMPQQRFSDVARTSTTPVSFKSKRYSLAHIPATGVEKAKARELSERQSVTRLLTNARFIINASLLVTAWVVLLMLIRVRYFSN